MSADISIFHSSEMDDDNALGFGFHIGAFAAGGGVCTEATGPYPTSEAACVGMTRKPIPDWLLPEQLLTLFGLKRVTFPEAPEQLDLFDTWASDLPAPRHV